MITMTIYEEAKALADSPTDPSIIGECNSDDQMATHHFACACWHLRSVRVAQEYLRLMLPKATAARPPATG